MPEYIKEIKAQFVELARKEILEGETVNETPVDFTILGQIVERFFTDLKESVNDSFKTVDEDEVWNWFNYMIHKGIAAAIATHYDRDDFELTYSFEEACNGQHPSFEISLMPIENEYSFNLRYNLNRMSLAFENYFHDIYDYLKENGETIKNQGVSLGELLKTILMYGCLTGTEFIARIPLTTDDYWPIRNQLILNDELFKDDEDIRDLEELDLRPEFDEPLIDEEDFYSVNCPFCGEEALFLPKTNDMWKECIFEPCEHFAFAFISNATAHVYGRDYYKNFFKRNLINYIETYKEVTCGKNYEGFLNDTLNGENPYLSVSELPFILKLVQSDLPDCTIIPKFFTIPVNGKKHSFNFHFLKYIKSN